MPEKLSPNWEKVKTASQIFATIAVPIFLAAIGYFIQRAVADQETRVEFVKLAIDILKEPPSIGTDEARPWARTVISRFSGIELGKNVNSLPDQRGFSTGWLHGQNVTLDDLIKKADSFDPMERRYAIGNLERIGEDAKPAAPRIVTALHDRDMHVRRRAAYALVSFGMNLEKCVPILAEVASDTTEPDYEADRIKSIGLLGELGDVARPAVGELENIVATEPDKEIVDAAGKALKRIRPR